MDISGEQVTKAFTCRRYLPPKLWPDENTFPLTKGGLVFDAFKTF